MFYPPDGRTQKKFFTDQITWIKTAAEISGDLNPIILGDFIKTWSTRTTTPTNETMKSCWKIRGFGGHPIVDFTFKVKCKLKFLNWHNQQMQILFLESKIIFTIK